MTVSARTKYPPVPGRPLFSVAPAQPGVYHSLTKLANRWVFYALGIDGDCLACQHPRFHELDEDVIASLEAMVRDEPRVPALVLVNADTISAAGAVASHHRPFSLPRLVR